MKRKTILIAIAALCCSYFNTYGQHVCNTEEPGTYIPEGAPSVDCDVIINYAPLIAEHTPVKHIRVIAHVFNNDLGLDNFPDDPASRNYIIDIIDLVNQNYANLFSWNFQ